MALAKTVSITMPPELLHKAQQIADREHRTMSELFREALRRYMAADMAMTPLVQRTRALGARLGIRSAEDVQRMSDEYRADKAAMGKAKNAKSRR
jgi:Arc/MetJ-type ribon-helix-helix transcriptional regulator